MAGVRSLAGPGLWPLLARLLIANLINAQRGEAGKRGTASPTPPTPAGKTPLLGTGCGLKSAGKGSHFLHLLLIHRWQFYICQALLSNGKAQHPHSGADIRMAGTFKGRE